MNYVYGALIVVVTAGVVAWVAASKIAFPITQVCKVLDVTKDTKGYLLSLEVQQVVLGPKLDFIHRLAKNYIASHRERLPQAGTTRTFRVSEQRMHGHEGDFKAGRLVRITGRVLGTGTPQEIELSVRGLDIMSSSTMGERPPAL